MSYYGGDQVAPTQAGLMEQRRPTSRERLLEQRKILSQHLQNIDEALEALDKNPDFELVHNLLTKVL
jgi:vacuolar-type H+-ATPase subunit E/Vma4